MEEITAYQTEDGRRFLKKEDAEDNESRLRANSVKGKLLIKTKEIFKDELVGETGEDDDLIYFKEDEAAYFWEGEEDLEDIEQFIDFLVDVATSHNGKTLKLMNYIVEEIIKVENDNLKA